MKWEFRGGMLPYLTFRKTVPNYDALEANRRKQTNTAPRRGGRASVEPQLSRASGSTESRPTNAYWSGFRGPNRDGRYDQTPITPHPPLLWKQPIGGGYASFAG